MAKRELLDLDEMTGDPVTDDEIATGEREPTWLRDRDVQEADRYVRAHLDGKDRELADMGCIDVAPGVPQEYWADLGKPGISDSLKNTEYHRLMNQVLSKSRQELDQAREAHAMIGEMADDLYDDFVAQEGGNWDPNMVRAGAESVIRRYAAEGTKNLQRRIMKDREKFLDDVSVELISGDFHDRVSGEPNRTAGIGGYGSGRGVAGAGVRGRSFGEDAPEETSTDMEDEMVKLQRRGGYV